ncbi:MAG TPA: hypothetical protein PLK77_11895 [Pyrinomonadaceae bacterium]|nr:hypothetical protein [Pyrinomonadaceae bacterium]
MKVVKILLLISIFLALLFVASLAVNYYYYSWTSFVQPFGCRAKVIFGTKAGRSILVQEYDLQAIGEEIQRNPNYSLDGAPNKLRLITSRYFGDLKYEIRFERLSPPDKIELSFLTWSLRDSGEVPTTPNYEIYRRAYLMIDEMPLNEVQKKEIKDSIYVVCSSTTHFGF